MRVVTSPELCCHARCGCNGNALTELHSSDARPLKERWRSFICAGHTKREAAIWHNKRNDHDQGGMLNRETQQSSGVILKIKTNFNSFPRVDKPRIEKWIFFQVFLGWTDGHAGPSGSYPEPCKVDLTSLLRQKKEEKRKNGGVWEQEAVPFWPLDAN